MKRGEQRGAFPDQDTGGKCGEPTALGGQKSPSISRKKREELNGRKIPDGGNSNQEERTIWKDKPKEEGLVGEMKPTGGGRISEIIGGGPNARKEEGKKELRVQEIRRVERNKTEYSDCSLEPGGVK